MLEERVCPDQILLGAMDPDFCVLLSLGCFLESRFSTYQQEGNGRRFLFGTADDDDEAIRVNERYQRILAKTWKSDEMKALLEQVRSSIGTNSLRKFPST